MSTDIQDLEQQKALDHIRDLMSAHWREAENAQDEDGKSGIGFKVSFVRAASPTKLKVTAASPRLSTTKSKASSKIRGSRSCAQWGLRTD